MNGRHLALFTLLTVATCRPAAWSPADEPAKAEKPAADSMLGKEAGDVRDDNGLKMKLIWCPAGFVTMVQVEGPIAMGIPDPTAKITPIKAYLTSGYWLGMYEVTQMEWKSVTATEPWNGKESTEVGDNYPATWVSWNDAMEFCRSLTKQERNAGRLLDGWEYRLPTEAQWERACRARTETTFSFGDDESQLDQYAWFRDNAMRAGEAYPHQVGQKKPNPWGFFDMHGNVYEWCRDNYSQKIPGGRDPEVVEMSSWQVCRGGGWTRTPAVCASAHRAQSRTPFRDIGFRVALSPVQPAK